jgi:peptidoglycan/LPS O-acetylase OafA/YrhL
VSRTTPHNDRSDALTGARALAGLYILIMHFGAPLLRGAPRWANTLRETGYVATSFFLMLSGFVLTVAYGKKLADGRIDRRGFLIQRIARLYPVFALALLLMVPFAIVPGWGTRTASFGEAHARWLILTGLLHATMSHVWFPRFVLSWNVPDWCVSVEMWFYAAYPLLVVWALRRGRRVLWTLAAASWATAMAISVAYTLVRPDGFVANADSVGFYISLYKFSPLVRLPEFVFGVALGAIYVRSPAAARGRSWATPLLLGTVAVGLVVLLNGDRIPYTLLHNGALLPLYGALVWSLLVGRGPLHRALEARPLLAIGNASYPLYLLQVPVLMWLCLVTGRLPNALGAGFMALALPAVVLLSWAVQRWFQPWAQKRLRVGLERVWRTPSPAPTEELALARAPAPASH